MGNEWWEDCIFSGKRLYLKPDVPENLSGDLIKGREFEKFRGSFHGQWLSSDILFNYR